MNGLSLASRIRVESLATDVEQCREAVRHLVQLTRPLFPIFEKFAEKPLNRPCVTYIDEQHSHRLKAAPESSGSASWRAHAVPNPTLAPTRATVQYCTVKRAITCLTNLPAETWQPSEPSRGLPGKEHQSTAPPDVKDKHARPRPHTGSQRTSSASRFLAMLSLRACTHAERRIAVLLIQTARDTAEDTTNKQKHLLPRQRQRLLHRQPRR
jgi:hypothetical protein